MAPRPRRHVRWGGAHHRCTLFDDAQPLALRQCGRTALLPADMTGDDPALSKGVLEISSNELPRASPPVTVGEGPPMAHNARLRACRRSEQRASCHHRLPTQLLSGGDLAIAMRVLPITETLSSNHRGHRDRVRGQAVSRRRSVMRRAEREQSARGGRPGICPLITQTAIAGRCHRRYCFVGLCCTAHRLRCRSQIGACFGSQQVEFRSKPRLRYRLRSNLPLRGCQAAPSVDLLKRPPAPQ